MHPISRWPDGAYRCSLTSFCATTSCVSNSIALRRSEDGPTFVSSTVDTVTRYVTASGAAGDPSAYAHRVAALFGSISLPYELGSAASFDFAGFNGRALNDNVMDVMLTLLVNAPLSTGIRPDPARFATDWPYLLPAAADEPTTHQSHGGR